MIAQREIPHNTAVPLVSRLPLFLPLVQSLHHIRPLCLRLRVLVVHHIPPPRLDIVRTVIRYHTLLLETVDQTILPIVDTRSFLR